MNQFIFLFPYWKVSLFIIYSFILLYQNILINCSRKEVALTGLKRNNLKFLVPFYYRNYFSFLVFLLIVGSTSAATHVLISLSTTLTTTTTSTVTTKSSTSLPTILITTTSVTTHSSICSTQG